MYRRIIQNRIKIPCLCARACVCVTVSINDTLVFENEHSEC
uniref:Uncharacterized protein n=1 Tax=Anguilla anguilla TaxID=7936 RepID=A0A0E9X223_ANGAN